MVLGGGARGRQRWRVARVAARRAGEAAKVEVEEVVQIEKLEEVVQIEWLEEVVVHEGEQLGAVDDLLRVQAEALEQLEVHRLRHAAAALGEELSLRRARGDAAVLLAVLLLAVGLATLPPAVLLLRLLLLLVDLLGGLASLPLAATAIDGALAFLDRAGRALRAGAGP